MSKGRFDPGNIQIKRNRKYEPIVDRLCSRKCSYSNRPLFQFNKDLMVFAAMVGYTLGITEDLEPDAIQIVLSTYASDEKDGFIYLIALMETQDASRLKNDHIQDSVKFFEKYCNGGLSVIKGWLDANQGDVEGVETLADEIYKQIVKNNKVETNAPTAPPVFEF